MIKFEDWRSRLNKEIVKRRKAKFSYGRHDCCFAAAACIKVMTGVDMVLDFGQYQGKRQALQVLKEGKGVSAIAKKFVKKYKIKEVEVSRAQAGDIILTKQDGEETLGVVELSARTFVVPKQVGWAVIPIHLADKVWRI
jgi:hypothetical protein